MNETEAKTQCFRQNTRRIDTIKICKPGRKDARKTSEPGNEDELTTDCVHGVFPNQFIDAKGHFECIQHILGFERTATSWVENWFVTKTRHGPHFGYKVLYNLD